MPGPAIAAVGAGLGGALIQGRATSKAAKAQAKASSSDLALQKKMFDRQDKIGLKMLDLQGKTINRNALRSDKAALGARDVAYSQARDLYGRSAATAKGTADKNLSMYTTERDRGVGELRSTSGANIAGLNRTGAENISGIRSARDSSIRPFQPAIGLGNNALQAYASNLGVGKAPAGYRLAMTPGSQFLMGHMTDQVQGSAAGRGGLYSGATMEALQKEAAGIASLDRDNQQAQLFGLGGLGQAAAGTVADIRMGAEGAIGGQRNLTTGAIGDQRNLTTGGINALRGGYADRIAGERSDYRDLLRGYGADLANGITNAADAYGARTIGIGDTQMGALGTARTNRANLMGSASQNYGAYGGQAIQNRGQANANSAIGWGNALTNGAQSGFDTYWNMGGQMPSWGQPQQPLAPLAPGWMNRPY